MPALPLSLRSSAVSLMVSGALIGVSLPLHPSILDRPVSDAVRDTPVWEPIHLAWALALVLTLVGTAGLVAVHDGALGRAGPAGLLITMVGTYAGVGLAALEALVFPVLADRSPGLLELQGPLLASPVFYVLVVAALGWPLGLALLGTAAARAATFPRMAGVALAISGPAFLALGGPFVPIVGLLSGAIFGAVQIWWGWLLWRVAAVPARLLRPAVVGEGY